MFVEEITNGKFTDYTRRSSDPYQTEALIRPDFLINIFLFIFYFSEIHAYVL